jgi:hypothetical protein
LARQPIIAVLFERDAERAGVQVVYKSIPDDDPITGMLLKNIMRGVDQWHSLTSKRKGLAGMAENVRQGWRAGGRAPRGYRLVSIGTGAVREGAEVAKTKLEPNEDAALVGDYLRLRAEGLGRGVLARKLKVTWPRTSLNGMEWNALTYAGHTVWNVHNEHGAEGYKGASNGAHVTSGLSNVTRIKRSSATRSPRRCSPILTPRVRRRDAITDPSSC